MHEVQCVGYHPHSVSHSVEFTIDHRGRARRVFDDHPEYLRTIQFSGWAPRGERDNEHPLREAEFELRWK